MFYSTSTNRQQTHNDRSCKPNNQKLNNDDYDNDNTNCPNDLIQGVYKSSLTNFQ